MSGYRRRVVYGSLRGGSIVLALVAAAIFVGWSGSTARAEGPWEPLKLSGVEVGGELGRRIAVTVDNNLLVIDVKKDFLEPFEDPSKRVGYVGLGKLIDSLVRAAAYTQDPNVIARKDEVVERTIALQQEDGYLGMFAPGERMWELWDVHEMSYLIYGLTSDYEFFSREKSLEAARRLADYIVRRWTAEPEGKPGKDFITVHMAVTGLERAMLYLSQVSRDPKYRRFCVEHRNLPGWDMAICLGRHGQIEGHAYAYMAHCSAQMWLNRLNSDPQLRKQTDGVLDFLLAGNGLTIGGACGDHECWHNTQEGTMNLGETCATAYLLRLLDDVIRLRGEAICGDVMERVIWNTLFAAQSPDGRRIRYYSPYEGPRVYFPRDNYCCPNNYRRVIMELPTLVCYQTANGAAINLYTPCTVEMPLVSGNAKITAEAKLRLRQETDYPNSGKVTIHVDPTEPSEKTLRLRIPRWAAGATVAVNDEAAEPVAAGRFAVVKRLWKSGDRLTLEMPMPVRLIKGRVAQAGRAAVMRGPIVYCLRRGASEKLKNVDLRNITLDPSSPEGPVADDTVRPNGTACKVKAWGPGVWYPHSKPDLELRLQEFADPECELVFFRVPNPLDKRLVDDELVDNDSMEQQ